MNTKSSGSVQGNTGYCDFVVGQHVVCIDTSNFLLAFEPVPGQELEAGRVYTVSAISLDYEAVALQVAEHPFLVEEGGWYGHWRFRPLQKLKVEDFMQSKTPVEGVPA
ncbi:hypothetical protein EVC08_048 [Rhizobium phage RHph_N65]|nr:hypothetical protein EVC08_048 [Rhizobium phage RHph_N65]